MAAGILLAVPVVVIFISACAKGDRHTSFESVIGKAFL